MKKQKTFSHFYALLRQMPGADKESLVSQFTDGRTTSLHAMSRDEYQEMIQAIKRRISATTNEHGQTLRLHRSSCMHQMQLYGIDTSNWDIVDQFCLNARISGKRFRDLDEEELTALTRKLRAMRRKQQREEQCRILIRNFNYQKAIKQ